MVTDRRRPEGQTAGRLDGRTDGRMDGRFGFHENLFDDVLKARYMRDSLSRAGNLLFVM